MSDFDFVKAAMMLLADENGGEYEDDGNEMRTVVEDIELREKGLDIAIKALSKMSTLSISNSGDDTLIVNATAKEDDV